MIRFEGNAIEIDALTIADAFDIHPSLLQQRIRDGALTTRCERGVDLDEGRYRLTFFTKRRRLRLIVDAAGNVLQRSLINFGELACTRFRRHQVWCDNGTGGGSWSVGSLRGSSSLKLCA
jgi:hypothetical protein